MSKQLIQRFDSKKIPQRMSSIVNAKKLANSQYSRQRIKKIKNWRKKHFSALFFSESGGK